MKKLILIILITFAVPSSISDVVSRHSNGRPKIINIYDASARKMNIREKQYFYENGQVKAKGIFIGSDSGRWTFYSNDGNKLKNPIELIDENSQSKTEADFYNKLKKLELSDESLKDDYNATTEKYDRFDLKLIEHGKHLKTLQDETQAHYVLFELMKLDIEQLEEKLYRLNDDIRNVSESFESYKRTANRSTRGMKNDITTLRDDLTVIDKQLNPEKYEEKKK